MKYIIWHHILWVHYVKIDDNNVYYVIFTVYVPDLAFMSFYATENVNLH